MKQSSRFKNTLLSINLLLAIVFSTTSTQATIVEFQTNFGPITVNLYDNATPETVANFLAYVNNGDYNDVIFHRTVTDFILQGGGFTFPGVWPLENVIVNPAVVNEPIYSNVRATIAMAKLGNNVNSATNQWFFNLADNKANLDFQNGGFTVFGEVINGMDVIETIAALEQFPLGGALDSIPLRNYTLGTDPTSNNLAIINSIEIIDTTVDSAAGLNPPATTNVAPPVTPPTNNDSGGGGGSMPFLILGLLGLALVRSTLFRKKR